MSKLQWDTKNDRESTDARAAFKLFLKVGYRAYTPRGKELGSFEDAKGSVMFKKIERLSALERILNGDDYGDDRNGARG